MEKQQPTWRVYTLADRVWDYKWMLILVDFIFLIILLMAGDSWQNILKTIFLSFVLLVTITGFGHLLCTYYQCPCGHVSPVLLGECANCSRPMPPDL